jgi:drug/metabolite transporter (DMT)-like permease
LPDTDPNRSDQRKGMLVSALAGLAFAAGAVLVPSAYRAGVLPGTAMFLRHAIATSSLIIFLLLSDGWTSLPRHQTFGLFLVGFLGYTVRGIVWFLALYTTPAWLVSLFTGLYPLPISIGSWILGQEVVTARQVWALVIVLLGGLALFWHPFEGVVLVGVVLMLINVMTNALLVLIGRRWTQGQSTILTTVWMLLGATLGTSLYAVLSKQLSLQFAPVGWLWIASFAIISTAVAYPLVWLGIELIGASKTAIIGTLEPVFAVLLSVIILGERMSMLQIMGASCILAGIFVVQLELGR